jgi:dipeptidyl aminopeptidase/acylaminoacyl peptidase
MVGYKRLTAVFIFFLSLNIILLAVSQNAELSPDTMKLNKSFCGEVQGGRFFQKESPLVAEGETDCITAEDIFNFEFVSDPQISPDGKKIVYVRRFADIMTDKRYSNLWLINFDGSGHRPLTNGKYSDSSPRWSPDGSQVIYISNRDGSSQIYKQWIETGQTAALTNLKQGPGGIAWSPDGKWIAFTANVLSAVRTIARMPAKPEGAQWAEPAVVIDRLVYRYDKIGYSHGKGYSHLFVIPAEGGTPRQLSSGDFNHKGNITWTPDSKYILMSLNRGKNPDLDDRDTEIFEFPVAGGSIKSLTNRIGPDDSPVISPDGKHIAYTGYDEKYRGFQVRLLYMMNRDGSGQGVVLKNLDRSVSELQWASSNKGLYFLYTDKGNTRLAYTSLAGKVVTLTGDIGGGSSAYEGGSYTAAANGHFAITYTRPDIPSEIAVGNFSDAKEAKVRVLTSVNQDILGHKKLGEVEETRYKSSFDGRDIQGWIIKPPHFDASKKYPLILEIHGGPFANYGDRFDLEKQLMAASGYVVLYTNPRGSAGYGEEFGNLIHHAYPGNDFYDLNSGVDAVVKEGYIDTENLFVTGGSGGGVLTCWMIGHTTRFQAAATAYPVINWYSWVLTADVPGLAVKNWFPGMPWDHAEHYEKRSLLSVVKNVKTPTMVICGEQDWRCPISESEQYYRALKLLGVESVLVRVPEEAHGIGGRPSHHISKVQHIIGWFDLHRK